MIDTHVHLTEYDDPPGVIERSRSVGVDRFVVPGFDARSPLAAVALASRFDDVVAAIGRHPQSNDDDASLAGLVDRPLVVAIGEVGFDAKNGNMAVQETRLRSFLALALTRKNPLFCMCASVGASSCAFWPTTRS